jgi:hypothetical protein
MRNLCLHPLPSQRWQGMLQELTMTEKTRGTEGGAPFCYINEANIKEDNKGTKCDIMKGLVSAAQGNVIIKLTANELRLTECHACGSTHPAHNRQLSRHLNCSCVQQATRTHLASRFRTIVFWSQLRSSRVKLRFPSIPWSPYVLPSIENSASKVILEILSHVIGHMISPVRLRDYFYVVNNIGLGRL